MSSTVIKDLEKNIVEWLDTHGNKVELNLKEGELRQLTLTIFFYSDPQTYFSIGFKQPIQNDTVNLEELQQKFNYVALDQLLLPGLDVPSNWNVYPQTPKSSFDEGVLVEAYENGRLRINIVTRFLAIRGHEHEEHPIMDKPADEDTYLEVRRDVEGVITIDMPLVFE